MSESSIGNYTIIRDIGEGGMARIYLASHRDVPSLRVILKVVSDPQLAERFRREAEKLAQLDGHPGICKIKHFFNHGRDFVIAMEYIDGQTIEERIERDGPFTVPDTLAVIDAVLDVLVFAHQRGIFHRDIKPSNIMIDADNRVKVIDFGIAKGEADPTLTAVNAYLGTPSYMAPEQFRSSEDINYASADIYAIGTTMYQMLTGELPYKETDLFLLRDAKMFSKPTRPRKLQSNISKSVEEIITTAMERDPEDRYPSVEVMRQAIQADKSFPGGARGDAPKIKKKRRKLSLGIVAAAVIVALVGAVFTVPSLRQFVTESLGMDESPQSPPSTAPDATPVSDGIETTSPQYGTTFATTDPIQFRWSDSRSDYDGEYEITVSPDGQFRQVTIQETVTSGEFDPGIQFDEATYFWRVGHTEAPFDTSAVMTFTVRDATVPTGRLDIASNLPVDILLDGDPIGRNTKSLDHQIDTGRHIIELTNDATAEKRIVDTVQIGQGATISRDYQFTWSQVMVTIRTEPPDALISVGSRNEQSSPASVRLSPGSHSATVTHAASGTTVTVDLNIQPGADTALIVDLSDRIATARIAGLRDSVNRLDDLISAAERRESAYLEIVDWRSQIPSLLDTRQADSARQVLENVVNRYNDILERRQDRRELAESTLESFMAAFAEKDLSTMEQLYPAMPAEEKKSWETFFKAAEGLSVDWALDSFEPSGATATADVTLTMSFSDRSGDRTETVPWRLELAEADGGWIVTARDAR